jgi:hypothetical protein
MAGRRDSENARGSHVPYVQQRTPHGWFRIPDERDEDRGRRCMRRDQSARTKKSACSMAVFDYRRAGAQMQ